MLSLFFDNYFPWFGDLLELGGNILLLIILIAFLMWGMIIERLLFFQFAYPSYARQAYQLWLARSDRRSWFAQQFRTRLLAQLKCVLNQHLGIINTLVKICPLAGLLGTVLGMLEVFDAVAATGANSPRATAAGVSKATISTMAGMVVAISGLLLASMLSRRAQAEQELISELLHYQTQPEVNR
ncbi:MotA/TolQ/ExbB proton channel family protein [Halioxenophilus sp. WMMB6]|uniref:MotA/TolQ/ExbB proton channel family protein n=1 Tax=Halioxenophilus sp. WMMB6 TaxID=3073815 RepID=UPI00295E39CF|nr:MotA/TolQ/ExbB proton channel family protein [Halioxenophilus sp. WMMB6]